MSLTWLHSCRDSLTLMHDAYPFALVLKQRVYRHRSQKLSPYVCRDTDGGPQWRTQPHFPNLPAQTPMLYKLIMQACLSSVPAERPSFQDTLKLMDDLMAEVQAGTYSNSLGATLVRQHPWQRQLQLSTM